MSTQIQQQQVQGLVALVSGVSANVGNLVNTGATLSAALAAAEYRMDTDIAAVSGDLLTTGNALSGAIVNNTNNLFTTGYLLTIDIDNVAANLVTTGATLEAADAVLSGNLVATGYGLADRLGANSMVASNLGIATVSSTQLYGEVSAIPAATCSNRILQWVGDVPPGTTSGLYLGGVSPNSARMPQNSQWFVKMYGTAKSIETHDTRYMGHTGICGLETGFVMDHESDYGGSTFLSGIDGSSGVMGSGVHYAFQVGTSGTNPGYLVISGQNSYTGTVRFHATAYVSQMGT
jgi:hypothetical protein